MNRIFAIFIFFLSFADISHAQLNNQDAIDAYYLSRDGEPLWIQNSSISPKGHEMLGVFEQAWKNGLNPEKYHVDKITRILSSGGSDKTSLINMELLLTDGYVQYFRDMSGMRVQAKDLKLDPHHWKQRMSAEEALSYLNEAADDIADFLLKFEPQSTSYQSFKRELVRIVEEENEFPQNTPAIPYEGIMRPGYGYDNVPALRKRLGLEPISTEKLYTYDSVMVQEVVDFQKKNGLEADGLVGKQTLYALNKSQDKKINQLIVNLERLRWVPEEKPERFIVVNIPSFTLWAVEDGKASFEIPVIVGRKERATPLFVSLVTGVRFNPTWTVPETIKREDILPKLQENTLYLADKNMELYAGYGAESPTLDPSVIDWANITEDELQQYKMVQKAGVNNPLGDIRVLMPNAYNVYLHDTNEKHYFSKLDKAQSSGCVRMKNPARVAEFILKNKTGHQESDIPVYLEKDEMTDVYTQEKLPIYMLYHTVWLGDKSGIVYGKDVYGYDRELLGLLQKLDETPKFHHNESLELQAVD